MTKTTTSGGLQVVTAVKHGLVSVQAEENMTLSLMGEKSRKKAVISNIFFIFRRIKSMGISTLTLLQEVLRSLTVVTVTVFLKAIMSYLVKDFYN